MTPQEILTKYKKIAVVGFSKNKERPSNQISVYMANNGYEVFGINPALGNTFYNEIIECHEDLDLIPEPVDIINVFRNPDYLLDVVKDVIEMEYRPKVIWTQLGVVNEEAKKLALEHGFEYVEDLCIYIEHKKLLSGAS